MAWDAENERSARYFSDMIEERLDNTDDSGRDAWMELAAQYLIALRLKELIDILTKVKL